MMDLNGSSNASLRSSIHLIDIGEWERWIEVSLHDRGPTCLCGLGNLASYMGKERSSTRQSLPWPPCPVLFCTLIRTWGVPKHIQVCSYVRLLHGEDLMTVWASFTPSFALWSVLVSYISLTTLPISWFCNLLPITILFLGRCYRMKERTLGLGPRWPVNSSFGNVWLGHILFPRSLCFPMYM